MTSKEQYIIQLLRKCRLVERHDKPFIKTLAHRAYYEPGQELTSKDQRHLGALWFSERGQTWQHENTAREWMLARLDAIEKGSDGENVVYRGVKDGRVIPLEAVEFYFCRARGIKEISLDKIL